MLISSNEDFFVGHLESFLASDSHVNKELLERFYICRGSAMYRIIRAILESLDSDEVAHTNDPFSLACMTAKYQCWRDENRLGISYTPEHITSPTKGSEFVTVIHLDFPEKYNLW